MNSDRGRPRGRSAKLKEILASGTTWTWSARGQEWRRTLGSCALDWTSPFSAFHAGRSGVELIKKLSAGTRAACARSEHASRGVACRAGVQAGGSGVNKESADEELTRHPQSRERGKVRERGAAETRSDLSPDTSPGVSFRPRVPLAWPRVGQADQPDCGGNVPEPEHHQHLPGSHSQEIEVDGQRCARPLRRQATTHFGVTRFSGPALAGQRGRGVSARNGRRGMSLGGYVPPPILHNNIKLPR